jgi:hypothetical protein
MRLIVANGLLVVLMLALLAIAVERKIAPPSPRVGVPCICPYKSAILCAIYCGG